MIDFQSCTRNGIIFFYRNQAEFDLIYDEVFHQDEYRFTSKVQTPLIIDCGSHIGISIAYFKNRFPQAHIIAFEPDPYNFALLTKMLAANKFTSISVLNKALASTIGTTLLYGDFQASDPQSCGHSIMPAWGSTRAQQTRLIETVSLRPYLTQSVDYLKMDIEGAEKLVIPSIIDKLNLVQEMHVEFHGTGSSAQQDLKDMVNIIEAAGLETDLIIKDSHTTFPQNLAWWVADVSPVLAIIHGQRRQSYG